MLGKFYKRNNGQSALEYLSVLVLILTAFFVFQEYIVRAFFGRWKRVGDSIGEGQLYDARMTHECAYSKDYDVWYDAKCFDDVCGIDDCVRQSTATPAACQTCVESTCQTDLCDG